VASRLNTHGGMQRRLVIIASLLSACATGAPSEEIFGDDEEPIVRPPVTYHKNGTVETGELRFASILEFQRSEDFLHHGRRCGSDRTPEFERGAPTDCAFGSTTIRDEYAPDATFTIPVVFHVIQKTDGTGHIPEALIHSQIDVLNEDFDALPSTPGASGHAGRIRFVLASTDPQGNPTTGIRYVTSNSYFHDPGSGVSAMKAALAWDPERYLNIYTNDASGALGYATFPSESAGNRDDGVVLLYTSVGRNAPQGGIYNQGRTATHEVGHYLGLFHTFQSGCGAASSPYTTGDRIADTVAHSSPDYNCTPQASSCGGGSRPIDNYMNYTPDTCMTRFTAEQVNRMRCSIVNYRSKLVTVDSGSNVPPTAAFAATPNNLAVSFVDQSSDPDGTIVARSWAFGDGATSTATNPSHTYAAAGTYTVTLEVTDNAGAKATHSKTVTVVGTTSTALTSGVPVNGLAAPAGGQLHYFIDVPAGATSLSIRISGGTGDADLYVRRGAAPTTTTWDHRPYLSGNEETVAIQSPTAGRYHVMVRGYTAFSGVTLRATVATATPGFFSEVPDLTAATGSSKLFSLEVPAGATNLKIQITGGSGDADLYVRRGSAPTTTAYDYRPYLEGNEETVTVAAPQAGTWYIMVRAYVSYSGVTLRVTYD
jgi:PKD repeat protein